MAFFRCNSGSGSGSLTLYRNKKTVNKSSGTTTATIPTVGNVYVVGIMCYAGSDSESYIFDSEVRIRRDQQSAHTETTNGFTVEDSTHIKVNLGFTAASTLTVWYWSDQQET